MFLKRASIFVLTLVMAVSLIGCGSSQAPADDPVTAEPAATEQVSEPTSNSSSNSIFDGTYWHLSFGPTNGGNYFAKFSKDGTFVAVCGLTIYNGTYKYDGTNLSISVDQYNADYVPDGEGFASVKEYVAQQYYHYHYTVTKIDKETFEHYYNPVYEKETARQTVLDMLSDYITVAKKILNDDIDYAESVYGTATELKAEPCYFMYTFPNAPVKFSLEYYQEELDTGTMYINIDDMGLSSSEKKRLNNACSIVYAEDDSIFVQLSNAHNGLKNCGISIVFNDYEARNSVYGFTIYVKK